MGRRIHTIGISKLSLVLPPQKRRKRVDMFGQQYTSPIASAAKWIFFGFFGVVLMGFLLGTNFKDATWLNRDIAVAKAERIKIENAHQQAAYELQEQLATAKNEAEVAKIRHDMELEEARYQTELARIAADQVHYERMLEIKANLYKGFMNMLMIITGIAGMMVIIVGTKAALLRVSVQPVTPVSNTKTITPTMQPRRHSPNGYEQMRIQARQRELLERYIKAHSMNAIGNLINKSKDSYNNLPRAGD